MTSPQLRALRQTYGERWEIQRDDDLDVWTAIRRPSPTALHILVAHDLPGLAAKLQADAHSTDW
jgi:hypothetical protein